MRRSIILFAVLLFLIVSPGCDKPKTKESFLKKIYRQAGDSVAKQTQMQLIEVLMTTLQDSGAAAAVRYCNIQAMELTASQAAGRIRSVQRLSDRNRNPGNAVTQPQDQAALLALQSGAADTVIFSENAIWYYKPIKIAMPTCLKCHGTEADLDPEALAVIQERYPEDKARGYQEGDFRGMWRVELVP